MTGGGFNVSNPVLRPEVKTEPHRFCPHSNDLLWSTGGSHCVCLCDVGFLLYCRRDTNTTVLHGLVGEPWTRHQHTCYPGHLDDGSWDPQKWSEYSTCVLKAIKCLQCAAYVCSHLPGDDSSTLLAVAVEMKYWPPGSHLAPNWAILLLLSPFRRRRSLLGSGCKR